MHVIILNGPKYCGKDTLCNFLLALFPGAIHARFKDVLYTTCYSFWSLEKHGMSMEDWIDLCNDPVLKDQPFHLLINDNGKYPLTPRQALIYMSEDVIKKEYGPEGVAFLTASNLKEQYPDYENKLFIFSDGGFNNEITALQKDFGIRRKAITIVRINRKHCNFNGDSREFIKNPDLLLLNHDKDPSIYLAQAKTDFIYRTMDGHFPIAPNTKLKVSDFVKNVLPFKVN